MSRRRWLLSFFVVALIAQLAISSAVAAPPKPAASGNPVAVAVPSSPVDETKVPHYFGPFPNYANSPFASPDVVVTIIGNGSGATATATVGANGSITGIAVTNPGSGYTSAPTVTINNGTGTNSSATATAAFSLTGSVTSIAVTTPGLGYTAPSVAITGTNTTPASATALAEIDTLTVVNAGSGYHVPTVSFSLPDDPNGTVPTAHAVCAQANCSNPNPDGTPGVVTINGLVVDYPGSGYSSAPKVEILDGTPFNPIPPTPGTPFTKAQVNAKLKVTSVRMDAIGSGYTSATVSINDLGGTPTQGAVATANVQAGAITSITVTNPGLGYLVSGIRKFVDTLPGVPGVTAIGANNLGQYIPVAVPDTTTYANSDYYEIAVVQYKMKMHSDLPETMLRGYVQLNGGTKPLFNPDKSPILLPNGTQALGVDDPHYLGPTISATRGKPVRILFRNLLPTNAGGDLFLPVDATVMGSGMGPDAGMGAPADQRSVTDGVRNPMCTDGYKDRVAGGAETMCFPQNRATLHLHGGVTPWISDGTPHQWITPAGEDTTYPKGVSVVPVPDMPDPGAGAMTFFYTNQQSARLMFYHDHAWGITRLNVYAGEAAGYLITDDTEKKLIANGTIPADQLPLIIQDKTFVPKGPQLAQQDPTWDMARWGGEGSLWTPHVYMPAQNPGDPSGMSGFGRWMYGPWFWPPATDVPYQPIPNPYYGKDPEGPDGIRGNADDWSTALTVPCNLDTPSTWQYQTDPFCEPPLIPGTPNITVGMEAFNDTPVVNGTAYPTVTLEPKSYRLRILNAANDRFWNLQWYIGDPTTASSGLNAAGQTIGATEVALKASELAAAQLDPVVFPTPDQSVSLPGPDWIQIGTEGGFLPAPVVIDGQQVTTWITDPTRFDVGNVDQHSLLLAPAERADVIVDFRDFAGKTLILYNDAPAAFPARVPSYDYYTGAPDLSPVGAPTIVPGYGPNTRTIMQVKIAGTPATAPFDLAKLQNAFKHQPDGSGVFESGQHPIIVGQAAYNSAYGTNFAASGWCNSPSNPSAKCDGYARINEQGGFQFGFDTLSGQRVNVPLQPKGIHDEMNSTSFDEYGRMQATIGLEAPGATPLLQNIILYPYVNPSSEIIDATNLPKGDVGVKAISSGSDGTQIWKITHNGVDTHPIHWHLYDVQVLNRVTWDNIIIPPDANELGWKDTLRVSPLEDTIVALRPIIPTLPFEVPNSVRPLNPSMPLGSTLMFNPTDANGDPTAPIINQLTNFGWEYVWHCHILSHEEMDMMRPVSVAVPPVAPDTLTGTLTGTGTKTAVALAWKDNSKVETNFIVRRGLSSNLNDGTWKDLATLPANTTTYSDTIGNKAPTYFYQVLAANMVGYSGVPGYSTLTATAPSNMASVGAAATVLPNAPSGLTAVVQAGPQVLLSWTDNATNETGLVIQRAVNGGAFTDLITLPLNVNTGKVSYTDVAVAAGNSYQYQVAALNSLGRSTYSTMAAAITIGATPAAPTGVTATAVARNQKSAEVTLTWADVATETGYSIQLATDAGFNNNLVTFSVGANVTTYTTGSLARNTPFYFRVQAFNAAGKSVWVNATPFPITTP